MNVLLEARLFLVLDKEASRFTRAATFDKFCYKYSPSNILPNVLRESSNEVQFKPSKTHFTFTLHVDLSEITISAILDYARVVEIENFTLHELSLHFRSI